MSINKELRCDCTLGLVTCTCMRAALRRSRASSLVTRSPSLPLYNITWPTNRGEQYGNSRCTLQKQHRTIILTPLIHSGSGFCCLGQCYSYRSLSTSQFMTLSYQVLRKGDRVVMPFNVGCGRCANCEEGRSAFCTHVNPGFVSHRDHLT